MEVSALAGNGMERAVETDAAVAAGLRHDVSGAVSDVITENDKNIYNFA